MQFLSTEEEGLGDLVTRKVWETWSRAGMSGRQKLTHGGSASEGSKPFLVMFVQVLEA